MKDKTSLLLLEQLVMVLVFALAAALCLQAFVRADTISRETARREEAVILAQNAAELLKAQAGDPTQAQALGGDGFRVEITRRTAPVPGLGQARIEVFYESELLFTLNAGWQEEIP